MAGLRDVVRHHRREQRVDRSQQSQHQSSLHQFRQMGAEVGHHQSKTALGNPPDPCQRFGSDLPKPIVVEQKQ